MILNGQEFSSIINPDDSGNNSDNTPAVEPGTQSDSGSENSTPPPSEPVVPSE